MPKRERVKGCVCSIVMFFYDLVMTFINCCVNRGCLDKEADKDNHQLEKTEAEMGSGSGDDGKTGTHDMPLFTKEVYNGDGKGTAQAHEGPEDHTTALAREEENGQVNRITTTLAPVREDDSKTASPHLTSHPSSNTFEGMTHDKQVHGIVTGSADLFPPSSSGAVLKVPSNESIHAHRSDRSRTEEAAEGEEVIRILKTEQAELKEMYKESEWQEILEKQRMDMINLKSAEKAEREKGSVGIQVEGKHGAQNEEKKDKAQ